jgi:hypothetical protein
MIYHCFEHISEEDEQKFVRKFREQPDDSDQIMHTYRELVLGAYLCSSSFRASYDHKVHTKTPDWCILDEKSAVVGIVELMNFHIDKATENEIEEQLRARGLASVWRDKNKNNVDRLYHRIWHKAQTYKALIEELEVPYVVAVFGDFRVAVDWDDLYPCLFDEDSGLLEMYPEVSGVLYFEEISGQFLFDYVDNPNALRATDLPRCVFPSGEPSAPKDGSEDEVDDSLENMRASKRRERWARRCLILFGILSFGIWLLLGSVWGLWGLGLVLTPLGIFFILWGVILEAVAHLSGLG